MKMTIAIKVFALLIFFVSHSGYALSSMKPLNDEAMGEVIARGLIVSDKIGGNELLGSNDYSEPFDFYRIGLDGELALNMNFSKLQLGCGGINDFISASAGCDIDIDFASLMGVSEDGSEAGVPGSDFLLQRPYLEFAIKNDDTTTMREVAGIKIGGQSASGSMTAGRRYAAGDLNLENTAYGTSCAGGATVGEGVSGCHSGINVVSGFLGTELSLTMDIQARIASLFGLQATGCIGRTAISDGNACQANDINDAIFVDVAGTRMQRLGLTAAALSITDIQTDILGAGCSIFNPLACGIDGIANSILNEVYASLDTNLRSVHSLVFDDTQDFFLSFQREPVAYPRYSKVTPDSEMTASSFHPCNSPSATARCDSAYSVPANTGWWLNAPSVKLKDIYNPNADLGNRSIAEAIDLLAAPGLLLTDPEFDMTPASNCYGSSNFC